MELIVHGTKHGYKTNFINKVQPTFALGDIRNGVNNEKPLGKSAYSLAFMNGGCVFTKYTIIRDTLRAYATGNIAFSLFLPANRELEGKGKNVKSLLDKLKDYYFEKYVRDNNINKGETTLIQEDWNFVQNILGEYKELAKDRKEEEITSGSQEPAIHYYKSENELIEHLDKPFQEEYRNYKQILFIDNNLKDSDSNPLNVLKNSGIEVNPDLNNDYFYLQNYNSIKGVKITANGKSRSDKKGENQIRAKWQVEINYIKEYYKPIVASGSISNLTSEIHKYLEINGSNIKIKYEDFLPVPLTKIISFYVTTKKDGAKVADAEIQIDDNQPWQKITEYTFTAEELGKEYRIKARKGDNLFSDVVKIIPKDFPAASITLLLIEKRVLKIFVIEADGKKNSIDNFEVWVQGKINTKQVDEVEFIGEEIYKPWNITVEKYGYHRSESVSYYPETGGSSIYFELKKQTIEEKVRGPQDRSRTNIPEEQKPFKAKVKTFFSKPSRIAALIFSALVLGIGIWALYYFFGNNKQPGKNMLNNWEINMYVEGDSLMLDKLNAYKENWKKQEQNFIKKSGCRLFGGDEIVDSTKWKNEWKPTYESIDRAIKKREFINDKNITELRNQRYSNGQLSFKTAIEKIDSAKYAEVRNQLGEVSDLTLKQIAEKINKILNPKETVKEETQQESKVEENKPEPQKETTEKDVQPKEPSFMQKQKLNETNKSSEIKKYIKGSELEEKKLIQYQKDAGKNSNLQASIGLCLKLWSLDGNGKNSYKSFQKELDKDDNLKDSKLKDFVDEMCKKEKPKYFNTLPETQKLKIKKLDELKSELLESK